MNKPCGDLLAHARRTRKQHTPIGLCDLFEVAFELFERRGDTDHINIAATCPFERRIFAAQTRGLHRAANYHHELIDIERLFNKVISALFDRSNGDLDVAVARNDDDGHFGMLTFDMFENVDPIHVAVFEPNIEDHQRRDRLPDLGHAFVRACREPGIIALIA